MKRDKEKDAGIEESGVLGVLSRYIFTNPACIIEGKDLL